LQLVCPFFRKSKSNPEWFVLFPDFVAQHPITIIHSNDTALASTFREKIGLTFLEMAHKAFEQLSLPSPLAKFQTSPTRVPDLLFNVNRKDSTLASMGCLGRYNGHTGYRAAKVSAFPSFH
jgi:hypothetical protein